MRTILKANQLATQTKKQSYLPKNTDQLKGLHNKDLVFIPKHGKNQSSSLKGSPKGQVGFYERSKKLLNLRGTPTLQVSSNNTAADKKESHYPTFISVDKAIEQIKKYKYSLRTIDLSHNALDIPDARKILEVARECPQIEQLMLKDNILMAYPRVTRFFDYDLSLFLKKPSVKEVNIQDNTLAMQTRWRHAFRKNYGQYADGKLVTKEGEKAQQLPYDKGQLGNLWSYFFDGSN